MVQQVIKPTGIMYYSCSHKRCNNGLGGIVIVYASVPLRLRSILWRPCIRLYWFIQELLKGLAPLQLPFPKINVSRKAIKDESGAPSLVLSLIHISEPT